MTRSFLLDLLRAGKAPAEAARLSGVSPSTAHRVARDAGLLRPVGRPAGGSDAAEPLRAEILCWHFAGESVEAIAARLECSVRLVHTRLREVAPDGE